ncbi:One cut domain family member [Aphelenchoides besseyi]|nr:One cut domain family member [Aphelenchoides besseyi]
MEPPAVSSCGNRIGLHSGSNNVDKNRRELMLRIDEQFGYASCSRAFEELPENFLETVSPQQSSHSFFDSRRHNVRSPSLSPGITLEHKFDSNSVELSNSKAHETANDELLAVAVHSPPPTEELADCKPLNYVKEEASTPDYRQSDCDSMYITETEFHHDHLNEMNVPSPISQDGLSTTSRLDSELREPKLESEITETNNESVSNEDEKPSTLAVSHSTDFLNDELDDNIFIDTKDLCKRIAYELKQHSIPQAIFAERVLCRSQGTLSDLLRNPKPWNKLKSGRETFRRMFNWIHQPVHIRLSILDINKAVDGWDKRFHVLTSFVDSTNFLAVSSPPTPAPNKSTRVRPPSADDISPSSYKKPRLVFTDVQKRTLQAIFKETQRPSREMQQTIADHLHLETATVANFFMNQRRRARSENASQQDSDSVTSGSVDF